MSYPLDIRRLALANTHQLLRSCPYLTAVGATRLYANQTIFDPESTLQANLSGTAQNFSTSGGFSNFWAPPPYQQQAVANFFAQHNPPYPYYSGSESLGYNGGLYNRSGRGYPDVSANGAQLLAYVGGTLEHWYGTSLAAPIWASITTLVCPFSSPSLELELTE